METIKTTRNGQESNKTVEFIANGGQRDSIIVTASQEGEYWFSVGYYKTIKGAIKGAQKRLGVHGYELNENEVQRLIANW